VYRLHRFIPNTCLDDVVVTACRREAVVVVHDDAEPPEPSVLYYIARKPILDPSLDLLLHRMTLISMRYRSLATCALEIYMSLFDDRVLQHTP
jgi:hypothetical protein